MDNPKAEKRREARSRRRRPLPELKLKAAKLSNAGRSPIAVHHPRPFRQVSSQARRIWRSISA